MGNFNQKKGEIVATAAERLELNKALDQLAGRSYAEIAEHLTQTLGRKVSRNTVRYYLSLTRNDANLPKGRPRGTVRQKDVWDQLIPLLLAITGLAASRLYRELSVLLKPDGLPFRESAFHERIGHQKRSQSATPELQDATVPGEASAAAAEDEKKATSVKKPTTLLTRCRLRVSVVEVAPQIQGRKRTYLFGYEEATGYVSFDVLANSQPSVLRISRFIKVIEQHLGLPVHRIYIVNIALPEAGLRDHLHDTEIEKSESQLDLPPLLSSLDRKTEIDVLQLLTKRQNDNVASRRVDEAKLAIAEFIKSEQSDLTWRRISQQDLQRRDLAQALKFSLDIRFKTRTPSRRSR